MHVFLAEHDLVLAQSIVETLREAKHTIDKTENGDMALHFLLDQHRSYDLCIIDSHLPLLEGAFVVQRLRDAHVATPILMITTDIEIEKNILIKTSGADDFLMKPFSTTELLLRVAALTARSTLYAPSSVVLGSVRLSVRERLLERNGTSVELTPVETLILEYFMIHPGVVVTRQELYIVVWGEDTFQKSNLVDVHIKNVRRKIEMVIDPNTSFSIHAVRSLGYRLVV